MNITDVGHLTDDGDQGEDKMEKWAKKEGMTVREIARKYENEFHEALHDFAIDSFDVMPRATAYMQEQIDMVKSLIEKWYTYVIPWDGIYMDTCKVDDYGKLAHLNIQWLCSHHRTEWAKIESSKKRQITDFALWKFSPADKQRAMERIFDGTRSGALIIWNDTPKEREGKVVTRGDLNQEEKQTKGFPGRHIECSAMSTALLWKQFDIHTGGVDHIPVHHTNEIVQSECALGLCEEKKEWVHYRMHQQFLNVDGGKMSKSKGHDLSVKGILAKGYDPLDVRYFYLTAHYRSFLDFTWECLEAAKKSRANMIKKVSRKLQAESLKQLNLHTSGVVYQQLCDAMANDLDTVTCLSLMHGALSWSEDDIKDVLLFDEQITKLWLCKWVCILEEQQNIEIPAEITALAEQRLEAKGNKDWTKADELRNKLKSLWWAVKDVSGGYELEKE